MLDLGLEVKAKDGDDSMEVRARIISAFDPRTEFEARDNDNVVEVGATNLTVLDPRGRGQGQGR
jgi:hypothetical protein